VWVAGEHHAMGAKNVVELHPDKRCSRAVQLGVDQKVESLYLAARVLGPRGPERRPGRAGPELQQRVPVLL
jgi:hypothetical protein